jgi:hypothetical protein
MAVFALTADPRRPNRESRVWVNEAWDNQIPRCIRHPRRSTHFQSDSDFQPDRKK